MSFKPCIYGLVDPLEPEHIRYIGYTARTFRMIAHEKEARYSNHNTHKLHWMRKLISEGRMFQSIILEEFEPDVATSTLISAEIRHIAEKQSLGHHLTNGTSGGDGVASTPEVKAKLRASWTPERRRQAGLSFTLGRLEKGVSKETRSKMGDSQRMRYASSLQERIEKEQNKLKRALAILEKGVTQCQE